MKFVETESRLVVAEGWGWGRTELMFTEHSFSFARWKGSGDWLHSSVNILTQLYTQNIYSGKFYVTCVLPQFKKLQSKIKKGVYHPHLNVFIGYFLLPICSKKKRGGRGHITYIPFLFLFNPFNSISRTSFQGSEYRADSDVFPKWLIIRRICVLWLI